MKKALVSYFSASGVTAKAAKSLAGAIGADHYEINRLCIIRAPIWTGPIIAPADLS